ncbi:MAG: hypothetical protein PUC46_08675, partial [Lachnospiraceae bacterium]|nr:hypothetical protein [Lachnospiraceae bacterium]
FTSCSLPSFQTAGTLNVLNFSQAIAGFCKKSSGLHFCLIVRYKIEMVHIDQLHDSRSDGEEGI